MSLFFLVGLCYAIKCFLILLNLHCRLALLLVRPSNRSLDLPVFPLDIVSLLHSSLFGDLLLLLVYLPLQLVEVDAHHL